MVSERSRCHNSPMTDTYELIEPPVTAGERDTLIAFLDYYRAVLGRKAGGLDHDQLNRTIEPSPLSLAALLKHMAVVESGWFVRRMAGEPMPEPWDAIPWADDPDWEINTAVDDDPAQLFAWYDEAIARSRAVTERFELDDVLAFSPENDPRPKQSLRWILVHLIEEYARHCGHADLVRETIDGSTGD